LKLKVSNSLWAEKLNSEFEKEYFIEISDFLNSAKQKTIIYPKDEDVFNALNLTDFRDVKVIILGQDPYHGINQAHGLSFSVNDGVKIPPSLKNIFKELHTDLGLPMPTNGNLTNWAKQGVLLLNATLTVEENKPGSHQKIGWEKFTDAIIKLISDEKQHCVFLLWGNFAKSKSHLIDSHKHLVLEAAHPSPLARGAFFGCKHFSKTNNYLQSHNIQPINWDLSTPNLFNQK